MTGLQISDLVLLPTNTPDKNQEYFPWQRLSKFLLGKGALSGVLLDPQKFPC